jgi:hypothetical protein
VSVAPPLSSVLTSAELALVAGFRARGLHFTPALRARLASQIAPVLRARLADTSTLDDESWLWALVRQEAGVVTWPVQAAARAGGDPGSTAPRGEQTER